MTNAEWKLAYERLAKNYDIMLGNKFEVQMVISDIVNTYNSGTVEDSDYADGVKAFLRYIVPILNKALGLKIPELKPEKECKVIMFKGGKD